MTSQSAFAFECSLIQLLISDLMASCQNIPCFCSKPYQKQLWTNTHKKVIVWSCAAMWHVLHGLHHLFERTQRGRAFSGYRPRTWNWFPFVKNPVRKTSRCNVIFCGIRMPEQPIFACEFWNWAWNEHENVERNNVILNLSPIISIAWSAISPHDCVSSVQS